MSNINEKYSPEMFFFPKCNNCKWVNVNDKLKCLAFPNGIPKKYLTKKDHTKVDENQIGSYVYTEAKND